MAILENKIVLSLEDLEENLGAQKFRKFVSDSEDGFLRKIEDISNYIISHEKIRAVFVSGPTSSGKTTFADRLVSRLTAMGKSALRLSLDDYYNMNQVEHDSDGRPDYESPSTIDNEKAVSDIHQLLAGETVALQAFDFQSRIQVCASESSAKALHNEGLLLVEGLHGLSLHIAGQIPRDEWVGIFIMPWAEIVADRRLFDSKDIRMLRRIVRDDRHRGAHALATLDYWPMVLSSEQRCFDEYLKNADFYVNSMLAYESMVVAPLAWMDISEAISRFEKNRLEPSVFMSKVSSQKSFANLDLALASANKLLRDLARIPAVNPAFVPDHSILNEFL